MLEELGLLGVPSVPCVVPVGLLDDDDSAGAEDSGSLGTELISDGEERPDSSDVVSSDVDSSAAVVVGSEGSVASGGSMVSDSPTTSFSSSSGQSSTVAGSGRIFARRGLENLSVETCILRWYDDETHGQQEGVAWGGYKRLFESRTFSCLTLYQKGKQPMARRLGGIKRDLHRWTSDVL